MAKSFPLTWQQTARYESRAMKAKEITALRETLGMDREKFAAHIGCSKNAVWRWESGNRSPQGLYLKALQDLAARVKPKKGKASVA